MTLEKYRIAGSCKAAASATKESSSRKRLRCLENSSFFMFWPFTNMETVERMVLSQWSLLDTFMCALSLVLVIDMNWIAARKPHRHQLARLARHWTSTSAYQNLFNARSCWELEQATWFLVATRLLEAVTQQQQQPRNLLHTKVEVPGKLQLFQPSTLRRRHSWSILPFAHMETLSHSGHCLTPACVPSLRSCWSIWTGLLHNLQDWQDIELAASTSAYIVPARQIFFNAQCSAHSCWELELATWLLINTGFLKAVTQQ